MRTAALALALLLVAAAPGRADPALEQASPRDQASPTPEASPTGDASPPSEATSPAGSQSELGDPLDDELAELLDDDGAEVPDPIEPWNRGVFWVNRGLDTVIFTPITRAYGWVMPDAGKRAVRRFFHNLSSPPILVNDLLQGEGRRALVTGTRFVVNTTVGLLGFFDPASSIDLERHKSDFGQTLFIYGVGSGPFVMLPIFGPSSARDSVGFVVDMALRPDIWLLGGAQIAVLGVGEGVSTREKHQRGLEELEQASVDFYAALRSVYWMDRERFLEESRMAREMRAQETAQAGPLAVAEDGSEAVEEAGDVAAP